MDRGNLYDNITTGADSEIFEGLLKTKSFKLERIISNGQATPPDEWFDQAHDEWVVLLKGWAILRIEGVSQLYKMAEGDYLSIPAHKRHRVEATSPDEPTIWLAFHFDSGDEHHHHILE